MICKYCGKETDWPVHTCDRSRVREIIISNKARCRKCGEVIESKHRHDFTYCQCGAIFVDGGKDYLRRGGDLESIEELSEITTEPK